MRGVFLKGTLPFFFASIPTRVELERSIFMNTFKDGEQLLSLLSEMSDWCQADSILRQRSATVSQWSVGQHCEHILKADRLNLRAIEMLMRGGGEAIDSSASSHPVLVSGEIPRGVAEAPGFVMPEEEPVSKVLVPLAEKVLSGWSEKLKELEGCTGTEDYMTRGIPHHEMGLLDIPTWIRFAMIHTRHHVDIAAEIQSSA